MAIQILSFVYFRVKIFRLFLLVAAVHANSSFAESIYVYPENHCHDGDALICIPWIEPNRIEWADRNYVLPGVHYAGSQTGYTRGLELSYFRGIGMGGLGVFSSLDMTPSGQRMGLGLELFVTWFGVDIARTSSNFDLQKDHQTPVRMLLSTGWISLYYKLGSDRQIGVLAKLPIKFDKDRATER